LGSTSERETAAHVEELPSWIRDAGDLVCFHFSTGQRQVTDTIERLACRKVLKFHNITPAEFFSTWSDELAEASRTGRLDMQRVARMGWEHVMGDSSFNLAEIAPYLPQSTPRSVVAPFHETHELLALRPSPGPTAGAPRIVTVGRITQSKGHALLLRAIRYLVRELQTEVVLDVVGKPDNRMLAYFRMLKLMVGEFGIEANVAFHGEVSSAALAQLYGGATAFAITSEHEGFCVPLIEAMAFGLPVVALGTSAVPETVGGAGIVWEERDPRRFALTLKRLLESPDERRWLAEQARARYAAFDNAAIEQRMVAALGLQLP
jgi:glycosyltransferase involved in cell wall biosynthesis